MQASLAIQADRSDPGIIGSEGLFGSAGSKSCNLTFSEGPVWLGRKSRPSEHHERLLVPRLRTTAREVVRKAARPGGSLERSEFTMVVARSSISSAMGLGEEGLNGVQCKGVVKSGSSKSTGEPDVSEI